MRQIFLILWIFSAVNLYAQDKDSTQYGSPIWQAGDTLVNFNRIHNNTVKTVELSAEVKLPDFLKFTQDGFVIFEKSVNEIEQRISFELKTITLDGEVYINIITLNQNRNQIPIVVVSSDKIDMATGWRADGKIYVVVAVSLVLFLILAIYLAMIDKKVSKLEK